MSNNRRSGSKSRQFESLEDRNLMAGNVMASLDAQGVLHIDGDAANNFVQVSQVSGNTYKVSNLPGANGDNTKINGKYEVTFANVKAIDVELKGGIDRVYIDGVTPVNPAKLRSVAIDMGGGKGEEFVGAKNLKIENNFTLEKQKNNPASPGSLNYFQAGNFIEVGGTMRVVGGLGDDTISVQYGKFGTLDVATGSGNDTIRIGVNEERNNTAVVAKSVIVDSGVGHDGVVLYGTTVDRLMAKLGDGEDSFTTYNNIYRGAAELDGGSGMNKLSEYLPGHKLKTIRGSFRRV